MTEGVGKDFLAPVNLASDSLSVGVEQEFGVVEAQPVSGLINALDTIAIELPGSDMGRKTCQVWSVFSVTGMRSSLASDSGESNKQSSTAAASSE